MNDRIKELYIQTANETADGKEWAIGGLLNAKRFAELIVRECLDIAQDRAAFDGFTPNDVNHIIDEIKEHFGVEL